MQCESASRLKFGKGKHHHLFDESNEVIRLIPYLGPELIAAILKRERTAAVDSRVDSESAAEKSLPARRSQSLVNGQAGDETLQHSVVRKTLHRLYSFWAEHIAR
jgi:hypothetical protein